MRRLLRWLARGLLALVLAGLAAAALGILYLRTDRGRAMLLDGARAAAAAAGGRLTADRIRVSLAGTVVLDGVRLSFERRSTLAAARVRVAWNPLALLWGEVRVGRLVMERPRVRLVRRSGSWGFPAPEAGGGAGPRVRIRRLVIEQGRVAVGLADRDPPVRVVLRDVGADLGIRVGPRGARADVRALRARVAGRALPALALRGGAEMAGEEGRIDAQLATAASTLALALAADGDGTIRLEADAARLAARDLRRLVPAWPPGRDVTGTLAARGPAAALETTLDLGAGSDVAVRARGVVDVLARRATLDLAGSTMAAPRVGAVRAEALRVRIEGAERHVGIDGALAVAGGRVEIDEADVTPLAAGGAGVTAAFALPDLAPWTGVPGAARGRVAWRGDAVRVEIQTATMGPIAAAGVATADVRARTARAELRFGDREAPERAGTVTAVLAPAGETWRADVTFEAADAARGSLRAAARVEPAASGIVARLGTLDLAEPGRPPWRLAEPGTLRWDGALLIEPLAVMRGTSRLQLSGRVRPGRDDALDLTVAADPVVLADVPEHVPSGIEDVAGRLDARLTLRGALGAPEIAGEGTLTAASARVPGVGTLEEIRVALRGGAGGALRIETLAARAGTGEISGTGEIGLVGGGDAPVRAALRLRRVPLARRPLYDGIVSGQIAVDGTVAAPRLTADLRVPRATVAPRFLPEEGGGLGRDPTITVVGEPEPERPPPSAAEALGPVAIHATVALGKHVRIVRKDADIRLAGSFEVEKAAGGPFVVRGPVELAEGWYEFRRRRFEIRRGVIRFTGQPHPDPELDVRARHRTQGYEVWVALGGTASAPTLQLSSEPPLSEADVLAVLLFGRPASQLGGDQQGIVGREAQSVALSYVAPALEESARDVLPIDRLEVSGEAVTVARNVTQDIFLSLSQEFGSRGGQTVGMEYGLTPRTSVKLSTSTRGSSAIDLFWHRRY